MGGEARNERVGHGWRWRHNAAAVFGVFDERDSGLGNHFGG